MKASRWEILGAWLRIWTPPRDVEIPPVPRRAAAVVAALCVAAIVVGIAVIAPAIDRAKERSAAQQARSDALFGVDCVTGPKWRTALLEAEIPPAARDVDRRIGVRPQ